MAIRPGEKLAVVGKNGAGKTTLIKLMCGLLDPTEGLVLLDGEDIRQYNRRASTTMGPFLYSALASISFCICPPDSSTPSR